jgi:hypothetical protein
MRSRAARPARAARPVRRRNPALTADWRADLREADKFYKSLHRLGFFDKDGKTGFVLTDALQRGLDNAHLASGEGLGIEDMGRTSAGFELAQGIVARVVANGIELSYAGLVRADLYLKGRAKLTSNILNSNLSAFVLDEDARLEDSFFEGEAMRRFVGTGAKGASLGFDGTLARLGVVARATYTPEELENAGMSLAVMLKLLFRETRPTT